jgi:hypothetical protein
MYILQPVLLQVVIDFGQELVTSVHRPVKWSNERPPEDDFKTVFAATRISAQRILQFVGQRQDTVRRLVLLNSEGYWSGAVLKFMNTVASAQLPHSSEASHFVPDNDCALQMRMSSCSWGTNTTSRAAASACCSACCTGIWKV